ncbi:MAG: YicC/YloC family endoribonuclease [Bacteroidales bacterium]|nr:YicC/YloC family endoribonuclease [Bacteroidales bacterium]
MIKSMTGFGKHSVEYAGKNITIELKSLNSKQFDANLRIPPLYRSKEAEIRLLLNSGLGRGKIEMYITVDSNGETASFQFNHKLAKQYYEEIAKLAGELNLAINEQALPALLRMPDIMKTEQPELSTEEWEVIRRATEEAMEELNKFRIQEGRALEKDLRERVSEIEKQLGDVKNFEEKRIDALRTRITKHIEEAVPQGTVDMNRFEQEIIYYLEKLDITEEKVRLSKHCKYFLETLSEQGTNGKKLGFIAQEMGREINTLGSKANDADMQRLVVLMKDELEKIKEQLFNIL